MQVTIHKLVWHLQAASQQAAAAGQKAAAELSRSSAFLAELETRLKALHLDEEHVVISKLEIDIGRLSEAEFNHRFASEVLRKLQLEVGEIASEKRVAEVKHVPLAQKRAAEFVYFVYTGNLPVNWPSSMRTQSEVAHWLAAEVAGQVVGEDVTGRLWVIAQVADYGPRRCGCCRQLGHNRRTCPQRVQ